jgi:hypothetical protein
MSLAINPLTGKHIKSDGAVYKKLVKEGLIKAGKACGKKKISNPHTGKCITINGAVYKKISGGSGSAKKAPAKSPAKKAQAKSPAKAVSQIMLNGAVYKKAPAKASAKSPAKAKECDDGKVLNPLTGKCITIGGAVYKKLGIAKEKEEKTDRAPAKVKAKAPEGCVDISHLAKYAGRPSPPFHAKGCPGQIKMGNDGVTQYKSVQASNGVWRWVKVKTDAPAKSPKLPSPAKSVSSRPSLSARSSGLSRISTSTAVSKKRSHHKKTRVDTPEEWMQLAKRKGFFIKKKEFEEQKPGKYLIYILSGKSSIPKSMKVSNSDLGKFTVNEGGYLLHNGMNLIHKVHMEELPDYPYEE